MSQLKRERPNRRKNKERLGIGVLVILVSFAVIYLIFASILISPKETLEVGEIAAETITAPREVEDLYSTEIAKQEARNAVPTSYKKDEQISEQVMLQLEQSLNAVDIVMQLGEDEYERMRDSGEEIIYTVEFYEECLLELPEGFITGDVANIIQISDEEEYIRLKEEITSLIEQEMKSGIIADSESNALNARKNDLQNQLILSGFDNEIRKLGSTLIDIYLRANMLYDVEKTEEAKDDAEAQVETIIVAEGEVIVTEGDEITKAQLEMLKDLGLVEDKNDGWIEYTAIGVVLLILCILIIVYLMTFNKNIAFNSKNLSLVMLIVIAGLLLQWVLIKIGVDAYFIPTAYVPLMIYLLLGDKRAAIYVNALLAVLIGFMYSRTVEGIILPMVLAVLISGTISVFAVRNASQRSSVFYAGTIAGIVMGLIYASFDLINRVDDYRIVLVNIGWGLASGAIVAVLTVGTLPLFEATYKIVTPMKLMELTNPNQPLLKKLLLEAPGTYHHSIMVGNMAERAADAVGADALLVRTAAYYHDVGKTKRPYFFVENHSDNRNPHDNIDSRASVDVITSHLSDGMDMLKRANIPPIVIEIASQHHGDTAVMYFYGKDKEESNYPENIKIENYRYKGERPKRKEAGILMLADSCEAAVRSLDNSTREVVKERIDVVVKGKLDDGQLDYCDLTLLEISKIKEAFLVALTGIFHERIEYPNAKEQEEG